MNAVTPPETTFWDQLALVTAEPGRLTSPWAGHIPFMFWLVDTLKPHRFVELGTHNGISFCAALQASARYPAEAIAIDTWQGDNHAGRYDDSVYEGLAAYCRENYGERAKLLRMTFDDALAQVPDASVDLLHIDGLHTYEAVRHDFETWLPKAKPNGVVLFHDTAVRHGTFGVWRLWDELRARYKTLSFDHSAGLGALALGDTPPALGELLAAPGGKPPPNALLAVKSFAALGTNLVRSTGGRGEPDRPAARTPGNLWRFIQGEPLKPSK
jgi:hypothetical protein